MSSYGIQYPDGYALTVAKGLVGNIDEAPIDLRVTTQFTVANPTGVWLRSTTQSTAAGSYLIRFYLRDWTQQGEGTTT